MAHRTQLHLDDDQYDYVKSLAKKEGKSIAQLIREWIEEKKTAKKAGRYEQDSFFKIRGMFESGVPDMAEHFDDYLYGDKK